MKLEKFKKESIADKDILSAIKGGASGISANFEMTAYQQFYESTCDEWNCIDMRCEGYEDGSLIGVIITPSNGGDCLY